VGERISSEYLLLFNVTFVSHKIHSVILFAAYKCTFQERGHKIVKMHRKVLLVVVVVVVVVVIISIF